MDSVLTVFDFEENPTLCDTRQSFYLQLDNVRLRSVKNKYNEEKDLFLIECNQTQSDILKRFINVKSDNKVFIQEDFDIHPTEYQELTPGFYNVIISIKLNPYNKTRYFGRLVKTKLVLEVETSKKHFVDFK